MRTLEYSFKTHAGDHGRMAGESFLHKDNLFVVTHGIGRDGSNIIGSELALNIISQSFFHSISGGQTPASSFALALNNANKAVFKKQKELGQEITVSVSAVYVRGSIIYFTHLGDSRIYSISKDEVDQLTRDHTVKEEDPYADMKNLDPHVMCALTAALGMGRELSVDVKKYPVPRSGFILMTTRGLTERITDRDLIWLFSKTKNPKKYCDSLLDLAVRKGSKEDTTAGVVRFGRFSNEQKVLYFFCFLFALLVFVAIWGSALRNRDKGPAALQVTITREQVRAVKPDSSENNFVSAVSDLSVQLPAELSAPVEEQQRADAELVEEINHFIMEWKDAWEKTAGENGDMAAYISFYSDDFYSNRFDKDEWNLDKKIKDRKKDWIRLNISDIRVSGSVGDDQIVVRFLQDYSSSNFSIQSEKMLILLKNGGKWEIVFERSYDRPGG